MRRRFYVTPTDGVALFRGPGARGARLLTSGVARSRRRLPGNARLKSCRFRYAAGEVMLPGPEEPPPPPLLRRSGEFSRRRIERDPACPNYRGVALAEEYAETAPETFHCANHAPFAEASPAQPNE